MTTAETFRRRNREQLEVNAWESGWECGETYANAGHVERRCDCRSWARDQVRQAIRDGVRQSWLEGFLAGRLDSLHAQFVRLAARRDCRVNIQFCSEYDN